MKTKIIIFSITLVLIVSVALKLKSNQELVEQKVYRVDPDKKVQVQAETVISRQLDRTFNYTGTFVPNKEIMLIPQAHGQVKGVFFNEGDQIKQGDLLLQIDDELLQAQYISAEATYQISKRNFERYEKASESDGVSKMQFDDYRLKFKNAESQLKQLDKQIRLSRITAPFSGTITLKDAELGSVVGTTPIGRLTDLTRLKLEISVPENEIVLFHEGDGAEVSSDVFPGKTFQGSVAYVAERADESHNYLVKVTIPNKDFALKAGMYGTVSFSRDLSNNALAVPRTAILGSAKNPQVFVVKNDVATIRTIQTGRTTGELVEVVSGVEDGEVVITSGHINLKDGSKVEVQQRKALALVKK
jgi:RND family efflux transporter MFP subunit